MISVLLYLSHALSSPKNMFLLVVIRFDFLYHSTALSKFAKFKYLELINELLLIYQNPDIADIAAFALYCRRAQCLRRVFSRKYRFCKCLVAMGYSRNHVKMQNNQQKLMWLPMHLFDYFKYACSKMKEFNAQCMAWFMVFRSWSWDQNGANKSPLSQWLQVCLTAHSSMEAVWNMHGN